MDKEKSTENSETPPSYVLTKKYIDYLKTGDTASYTRPEIENRIKNKKVDRLDSRFHDLFRDISELYSSGYLDEKAWEDGWENLVDFKSYARKHTQKDIGSYITTDNPPILHSKIDIDFSEMDKTRKDMEFGVELGLIVKFLLSNQNHDKAWRDVLWGFILAFITQPPEKSEKEKNSLQNLIKNFYFRAKNRLSNKNDSSQKNINKLIKEKEAEKIQKARKALNEKNITYTEFIKNFLFKYSITNTIDPSVDTLRDALGAIILKTKLEETEKLSRHLKIDEKHLKQKEWRGTKAIGVFEYIYKSDGVRFTDIPEKVKSDKTIVKKICLDLAGKRDKEFIQKRKTKIWKQNPLIKEKRNIWKTTNYGKLLGHKIYKKDTKKLLQRYALRNHPTKKYPPITIQKKKKEMINKALKEIDLVD